MAISIVFGIPKHDMNMICVYAVYCILFVCVIYTEPVEFIVGYYFSVFNLSMLAWRPQKNDAAGDRDTVTFGVPARWRSRKNSFAGPRSDGETHHATGVPIRMESIPRMS